MMRVGLATLVWRLNSLVNNDPAGATFSDDELANALDAHRWEMRWVPLRPSPTFSPGGIHYLDFYSDAGGWASDYVLQDMGFNDVTGDVSLFEAIPGHWRFSSQPQGIAVRATGTVHDIYAAAADLLEWQASQVTLQFDFQNERQSFTRSQQGQALLALAARYRAQAMPTAGRLWQGDAVPEFDGGGVVYPRLTSSGPYGGGF